MEKEKMVFLAMFLLIAIYATVVFAIVFNSYWFNCRLNAIRFRRLRKYVIPGKSILIETVNPCKPDSVPHSSFRKKVADTCFSDLTGEFTVLFEGEEIYNPLAIILPLCGFVTVYGEDETTVLGKFKIVDGEIKKTVLQTIA